MSIKIITDSSCDLSQEFYQEHNVELLPLYIIKEGESFKDMIEITSKDVFDNVANGGDICTTSAVNMNDYATAYEKYSKDYDDVLCITISSEVSSCYQNACIATEGFDNVHVFNSMNISTGHGYMVMDAVEMAEAGCSLQEIIAHLNELVEKMESTALVDQLDYLKKGGRCSAVLAMSAKLLKIKPAIQVIEGTLSAVKKYQGSYERCLKKFLNDKLADRTDINLKRIIITHTHCTKAIVDSAVEIINSLAKFKDMIITTTGVTISTHCGPGTVGILFATI